MAEQSANVTLQEIVLENNKTIQSSNTFSLLEYSQNYSFLEDPNLSLEHLELQKFTLNQEESQYQIRFYEVLDEKQEKDQQQQNKLNDNSKKQDEIKQKIASLNIRQQRKIQTSLKLPITKRSIQLQLQTKESKILQGTINQTSDRTQESPLYNADGNHVATLHYELKRINERTNQEESSSRALSSQQAATLQSREFQRSGCQNSFQNGQISLYHQKLQKIEQDLKKTLGKIQQQGNNTQNVTTINTTSSKRTRVRRRKKYYTLEDGDLSEIEEKGVEERQIQITEKIVSYKMPLGEKLKLKQQCQIDYYSLKKSQQELGLNDIDIEKMLYPKSLRIDNNKIERLEDIIPATIISQDSPIKQAKQDSTKKKREIQSDSSMIYSNKVQLQDFGVGTYTPLASHKSSLKDSFTSFRSKSIKANSSKHQNQLSSRVEPSSTKHTRQNFNSREKSQSIKGTPNSSKFQKEELGNEQMNVQLQTLTKLKKLEQLQLQLLKKQQKLILQNKIIEIKVGEIQRKDRATSPFSLKQQKRSQKQWSSCKESPLNRRNYSNYTEMTDSSLFPEYCLTINNISLNFRKKTFGGKQIELILGDIHHETQPLSGVNLIWVGKNYSFQQIVPNDQIIILVKGQSLSEKILYGKVKITFNDLLINKKQSYYQTLLLNDKEVLGVLILGFQILKKKELVRKYNFPVKKQREHSIYSEAKKDTFRNVKQQPRRVLHFQANIQKQSSHQRLPSPKTNRIKMKKYLGGKNIKIGRAHRFQEETNKFNPGPGNYQIQSVFSRHAYKEE